MQIIIDLDPAKQATVEKLLQALQELNVIQSYSSTTGLGIDPKEPQSRPSGVQEEKTASDFVEQYRDLVD